MLFWTENKTKFRKFKESNILAFYSSFENECKGVHVSMKWYRMIESRQMKTNEDTCSVPIYP